MSFESNVYTHESRNKVLSDLIRFPAAADFIDLCADLCEAAVVVFVWNKNLLALGCRAL